MVVDVPQLAIRQDLDQPAEMVALGLIQDRAGVVDDARGKHLVRRFVVLKGDPELHQIVAALGAPGGLARGLDRRQEQRDQDRDDRDHDQELDQGERRGAPADGPSLASSGTIDRQPRGSWGGSSGLGSRSIMICLECRDRRGGSGG